MRAPGELEGELEKVGRAPEELDCSGVCGGEEGGRGQDERGSSCHSRVISKLHWVLFHPLPKLLGLLYSPLLTSLERRLWANTLESQCPPQAQELCVL